MILCRQQHIKTIFLETDANWQGIKHFIVFCNQGSLCVLYKCSSTLYNTLLLVLWWELFKTACIDIFFFLHFHFVYGKESLFHGFHSIIAIISRTKSWFIYIGGKKQNQHCQSNDYIIHSDANDSSIKLIFSNGYQM